jgi:hypothetical protein
MKTTRFVLKIIAYSLAMAAFVCAVIAYWDKIAVFFGGVKDKVAEKRCFCRSSEYDDYADWDE